MTPAFEIQARRWRPVVRLAELALLVVAVPALAADPPPAAPTGTGTPAPVSMTGTAAVAASEPTGAFAMHGQATFTIQGTPGFGAPYAGPNSLAPHQIKETFDATWFIGARLWRGAQLWIDPEIDQGFGLSNTLGIAGFPSGEAYKVGRSTPYFRMQRAFIRQTVDLGGEAGTVAADANVMADRHTANRLVFTLGKFSVGDVFDTNAYAHDPRADFLNWAIIDTGSFDYSADAWGYSLGAAGEWYQGDWTLRAGLFNLSTVPNGELLETNLSQFQIDGEIEHRHTLHGHPGAIRLAFFRNHGRFEKLSDAISIFNATGAIPDAARLRRPLTRWGGQVNAEQELSDALGVFLRAGTAGGSIEVDEFADIDRSVTVGGRLKGKGWGRAGDSIGLALLDNHISRERRQFLADGGVGILVGDGRLPRAGDERIIETYYDWQVIAHVNLTADYQFVASPAYNRDRGPVHVFALRLHVGV